MGRLSAEDQATLDRLTALRDAPDEPVEVWIRDGGREYKVSGSNAEKLLRKLGIIDDDEDQGDDATAAPAKKAGKKAVPAKKAGGRPPVDDEDQDDEDQDDEDQEPEEPDPPQTRRHFALG